MISVFDLFIAFFRTEFDGYWANSDNFRYLLEFDKAASFEF